MRLTRDSVVAVTQNRLGRLVDAVPAAVAARLAGRSRDIDGQVLDPTLALILAFEERLYRPVADRSAAQRRAANRVAARAAAGQPIAVGAVRDLIVDGGDGPLRARHYRPPGVRDGRGLLVFFHGGGWVEGDLDTHDQPCRLLARNAGVHVLSVDYRLAPEHPFPAAVDDAVASFGWALAHAAELGADPGAVAVGGDSAGGNLAAVVSQHARDTGGTPPVAQLLIYPAVDTTGSRPSRRLFARGYYLTTENVDWFLATYSDGARHDDPRLSPMFASSLAGLPPAVVTTAAFDPLRDEGEAYARALRDAGVPVVLRRAEGLVHGYLNMTGIHRASRDEAIAVAAAFGALLETLPH